MRQRVRRWSLARIGLVIYSLVTALLLGACGTNMSVESNRTISQENSPSAAESGGHQTPSALSTGDEIAAVAERLRIMGDGAGFVGIVTHYERTAITAFWKGDPPAEVDEYASSKPQGVTVAIVTASTYSRNEGEAARQRVLEDSVARDLGVISASVRGDGSGIEFGLSRTEPLSETEMQRLQRVAGISEIFITYGLDENALF